MIGVFVGVAVTAGIIASLAFLFGCGWVGMRLAVTRWGERADFLGAMAGALTAFAVLMGILTGLSAAGVIR